MNKAILQDSEASTSRKTLYMAMELSNSIWKLGFSTGTGHRVREVDVAARDLGRLYVAIEKAKERFGVQEDARVLSCFEAGRDGFWIHRFLESKGIENLVVDSSSIGVPRKQRRRKTDRLDLRKLLAMLIRHAGGEKDVWSVVRVPSMEDEDDRRLHRERERLLKERTGHINRIKSLLTTQGVKLEKWRELEDIGTWNGSALPRRLKKELERECERLELLQEQIKTVEKEQRDEVIKRDTEKAKKIAKLMQLKGIGMLGARILVMELFGWRKFKNRKEVGALAGLTGTPFASGDIDREQGISKAGNRRVRTLMIELAWMWLRFQPKSELTLWFNERYAKGKRMRRVGIVAVARRLLIELWRYVEHGVIPPGAVEKTLVYI